MKVAVFGDIHGNIYGLNAIIEDIKEEKPDSIYCTGDLFIPFPGANKVWDLIIDFNIKCVRGNGEDRLIEFFKREHQNDINTSIQYRPTQFIAKKLDSKIVNSLEKLPLILEIKNSYDTKIMICHGTPYSNQEFLIDPEGRLLIQTIDQSIADIIIAGHSHIPYQIEYNNVQFISVGSGGLSLIGKPIIYYLILEYNDNNWEFSQKALFCDYNLLIKDLIETNFLYEGSPISWLMLDELLCFQNRVYKFFLDFYPKVLPNSESEWERACIQYLKMKGRWKEIKEFLSKHLGLKIG
ncbi:MAG: metallophosphoesterase [Candidatus Lokiarchaeota archaeon]|nr:metallophosphoesterase [Candidatus Lokiarchaeota archaeon]